MSQRSKFKLLAAASAVAALGCMASSYAQEPKTSDGIVYVSGGVGEDSRDRLNSQAREYNLRLMFTLNEGNFLSDVNVAITDAKGKKVIEDVANGPFFMAKLPAGSYTVTATYQGKTQTRKIQAGKGSSVAHMRWPSNPQTDNPVARDQAGPGKKDLAG